MGDGFAVKVKSGGFTLSTDSYFIEDVVRLMNVLIIRFDLKCSLHLFKPDRYKIFISKRSMNQIKYLVR